MPGNSPCLSLDTTSLTFLPVFLLSSSVWEHLNLNIHHEWSHFQYFNIADVCNLCLLPFFLLFLFIFSYSFLPYLGFFVFSYLSSLSLSFLTSQTVEKVKQVKATCLSSSQRHSCWSTSFGNTRKDKKQNQTSNSQTT